MPDQPQLIDIKVEDYAAASPLLIMAGTILLLLVVDLLLPERQKQWLARLATLGVIGAGVAAVLAADAKLPAAFNGMVLADNFAAFTNLTLLAGALLTILVSSSYIQRIHLLEAGEYYALLLATTLGMMLLASASNFMVQFLGLGLFSLGFYILAGFTNRRVIGQEAALKYFLLSSFATAFFLYGVAFVYGATGTTGLIGTFTAAVGERAVILQVGLGLIVVGLGFKVSAVPFHMWTPDVYQGAPAPVTMFMAIGTKVAAFAAIFRIFNGVFADQAASWQPIWWTVAVLTMVVGNLAALRQTELKRLLAYSSVAHAGYILVGVVTNTTDSVAAALYYLAVYTAMNAGAFAVLAAIERADGHGTTLAEIRGLASRKPVAAALMTVFLLSLTGIPPLAGFFSKLAIFVAAAPTQLTLVVVGLLASTISAYYYLRVAISLYSPANISATYPDNTGDGSEVSDGAGVGGDGSSVIDAVPATFTLREQSVRMLARREEGSVALLDAPIEVTSTTAVQQASDAVVAMHSSNGNAQVEDNSVIVQTPLYVALGLAAVGTVGMGLAVKWLLDWAQGAAVALLR